LAPLHYADRRCHPGVIPHRDDLPRPSRRIANAGRRRAPAWLRLPMASRLARDRVSPGDDAVVGPAGPPHQHVNLVTRRFFFRPDNSPPTWCRPASPREAALLSAAAVVNDARANCLIAFSTVIASLHVENAGPINWLPSRRHGQFFYRVCGISVRDGLISDAGPPFFGCESAPPHAAQTLAGRLCARIVDP